MAASSSSLSLGDLEKKLNTTPNGLSSGEASKRLASYGPNELPEKKRNPLLIFLSYFWGPIPWMIEAAFILSGIVRHWADFFIILALLFSNAIIGFFEEHQAGNAIAALKAKLALKAIVRRDGKWADVESRELVPGDIIRTRIGDIIPADTRLLDGDPIEVDQSMLTGESLPVEKKSGDVAYSGSIVRRGEIDALVYETGGRTYFGKTAELVGKTHDTSHFQRAVLKIGNYLIAIAIVFVLIILGSAVLRGDELVTTLEFTLVLLVAAIPVAMPTVLSVTMAVGARLLAKKQAIVSRLSSIEELAGIDILCSDKTGTLTQNKLKLDKPYTVEGIEPEDVIIMGALATRAEDDDVIDLAVLAGLKNRSELDQYKITHFEPFDPVKKRSEAAVTAADGHAFSATLGAAQMILALSANRAAVSVGAESAIGSFAERGFRSLGVARTDASGKWQFIGILPLSDPLRDDAKNTIETAEELGIKVKMVTGDQLPIAKEIAKQLGLGQNIFEADKLLSGKDGKLDPQAAQSIENADGFAQVFPEHKYHIVEALEEHGHLVGMTGDGVNDAPALKRADCGIAVSSATDAARAAADIVLLTPGLSVIIDAIKESRRIFQRMTSYSIYRISETIRVLLFMSLSIIVFNFYPVTAVMIVLLALLNDGAVLTIAFDHAQADSSPDSWHMRKVLGVSSALGVIGVVATFLLFYLAERVFNLDRTMTQTLMYLKLSVAGQMTIFITRTKGPFWSNRPSSRLLTATTVAQIIATLVSVYGIFVAPIGWGWAIFVWLYAAAWLFLNDRIKILAYRIFDRGETSIK